MHPAWLRCESLTYLDMPALSRLAGRVPQRRKMKIYFYANPKPDCAKRTKTISIWMSTEYYGQYGQIDDVTNPRHRLTQWRKFFINKGFFLK